MYVSCRAMHIESDLLLGNTEAPWANHCCKARAIPRSTNRNYLVHSAVNRLVFLAILHFAQIAAVTSHAERYGGRLYEMEYVVYKAMMTKHICKQEIKQARK